MAKPYCNAIKCPRLRIRPNSTHCDIHDVEWRAIQRDQKRGVTAALMERRVAMGMTKTPRS